MFPAAVMIFLLAGCSTDQPAPVQAITHEVPSRKTDTLPDADPLLISLAQFRADSTLRHASIAYCFLEDSSDRVIAELNPALALVPASAMKLFTTAAALEILKPETRFKTSLHYEGTITGKTLHGNIILKGGGDPTFCHGEQTMKILFTHWAGAIKKLGIDSVDGSVIGDGRVFDEDYIPYTWTWGEINLAYCAAASGLSVNGNLYQLFFDPVNNKRFNSGSVSVMPVIPEESFHNRLIETATDEEDVFLVGHPQTRTKTLRGVFPKDKKEVSVVAAVSNPTLVAASEFLNALAKNGVTVTGKAFSVADSDSLAERLTKASIRDITAVQSPTVSSIVYTTNQSSYNFFAENLLKHMGVKIMRYGGTEAGTMAVQHYFKSKGMPMGGFAMFDGSGISRFNTATVSQMVWLLSYMQNSPASARFKTSLSVAGVSGTPRTMCINGDAEGMVQAKRSFLPSSSIISMALRWTSVTRSGISWMPW
jgi:D-alanyl-D-alanine carboxypeptidase/D-alanyl-D-alanine-endopeptidase (penicillin-binding protein 4)